MEHKNLNREEAANDLQPYAVRALNALNCQLSKHLII